MTSDRKSFTAMSLAALDDRESIETRPLDAVKAELEALGIDPGASIERAQQYARERSRPANRLLARLDESEALDAEIEALEKADIADIRDTVQAGVAASIAGDAKRRAGVPSNVTALKSRRRRFWGWGGSMVGIAACLLLFVVARPDQLYQVEQTAIDVVDDATSLSKAVTVEEVELGRAFQPSTETRGAEKAEAADSVVALAQPEERAEQQRLAPADAAPAVSNFSSGALKRNDALDQPAATARQFSEAGKQASEGESVVTAAAPTPAPKVSRLPMAKPHLPTAAPEEERTVALAKELEAPPLAADMAEPGGVDTAAEDRNGLLAILIVDPDRVPAKFKSKAASLPEGNLADRLDEARTLIGDRIVVALVTSRREGQTVDAVIAMPKQKVTPLSLTENSRAGFTSSTSLAPSDLENDEDFELIELPSKP